VKTLFRTLTSCALAVFIGAVASPALAQWKWRDANGSVQFSDRPPPITVPERNILQRPAKAPAPSGSPSAADNANPSPTAQGQTVSPKAPATPTSAGAANPADAELERRRKAADQEKADKAKADEERRKATRAENCARARSAAATYESGQRVARINEQGEREFLDDRQRAEEAKRARDAMASECR
jgi:hypothetical protein